MRLLGFNNACDHMMTLCDAVPKVQTDPAKARWFRSKFFPSIEGLTLTKRKSTPHDAN
jgi:hypothetical protein